MNIIKIIKKYITSTQPSEYEMYRRKIKYFLDKIVEDGNEKLIEKILEEVSREEDKLYTTVDKLEYKLRVLRERHSRAIRLLRGLRYRHGKVRNLKCQYALDRKSNKYICRVNNPDHYIEYHFCSYCSIYKTRPEDIVLRFI